jgi:DNA-binding MarR family transcriptional regulator
MDYTELAEEFLQQMRSFRRFNPQQKINESMHGEAFVLHHITRNSEQIIPSEISSAMGISGARIAAALNSLEKKGYIIRQIDPIDRRRILVTPTDKGREQEEANRRKLVETIEKMLRMLGENDAKEYIRISRKIAELAQCDEE